MPIRSQPGDCPSPTEKLTGREAHHLSILMAAGAMSIAEFCEYVGICRTTAHKLIKSGELQTKLAGRRRLIPVEAVEAWLKG